MHVDFSLLVSGPLAKPWNGVTCNWWNNWTVISRCAPFDLVKVQKGLLHESHGKRGQTISFYASFLFIMPIIPTTSLGQLEKLQGFFSHYSWHFVFFSQVCCVSLKWLLTVGHETPQNASWQEPWLAEFISEGISWAALFQKCEPEQFLSLIFVCVGNCLKAFGQNDCAGFPGCRHMHWRHGVVGRDHDWWRALSKDLLFDHDFLSCHNEEYV